MPLLKGHALEQRHHPEGLRRLHQEAAAGAAEGQGAGEPAEEAGARQPTPDAEDTGKAGFPMIFSCRDGHVSALFLTAVWVWILLKLLKSSAVSYVLQLK